MQAPIACVTRAWRSFGRLSGSQPSAWFWAWSWDPLKFMRRHPPHHLSPARANHPAGQDPEALLSRPSHHSNAPIKPESQSILSKIVALTPSNGPFGKSFSASNSDMPEAGIGVPAYDYVEAFAEKFRALAERTRPRPLRRRES